MAQLFSHRLPIWILLSLNVRNNIATVKGYLFVQIPFVFSRQECKGFQAAAFQLYLERNFRPSFFMPCFNLSHLSQSCCIRLTWRLEGCPKAVTSTELIFQQLAHIAVSMCPWWLWLSWSWSWALGKQIRVSTFNLFKPLGRSFWKETASRSYCDGGHLQPQMLWKQSWQNGRECRGEQ